MFSESGSTAYAFDFNPGQNRVEIGGVPAIIHRWQDKEINVWVPYSAKSGSVVVKRGATIPKPDGTCCAQQDVMAFEVGSFTVKTPKVTSYSPIEAGIDEIVTLKGEGFGEFLKIAEATRLELNTEAHDWKKLSSGSGRLTNGSSGEWGRGRRRVLDGSGNQDSSAQAARVRVRASRRVLRGPHQRGNRRASRVLGFTQEWPVLFPEAVAECRGGRIQDSPTGIAA